MKSARQFIIDNGARTDEWKLRPSGGSGYYEDPETGEWIPEVFPEDGYWQATIVVNGPSGDMPESPGGGIDGLTGLPKSHFHSPIPEDALFVIVRWDRPSGAALLKFEPYE